MLLVVSSHRVLLGFEGGISCQSSGNSKNILQNPPKRIPRGIKLVQNKVDAGFIPHVGVKLIPKGDATAIKANRILGLSLTIST